MVHIMKCPNSSTAVELTGTQSIDNKYPAAGQQGIYLDRRKQREEMK